MSSRKDRALQKRKGRTVMVRPLVSAWRLKNPDKPFSDSAVELAEHILRRNDDTVRIGRFSPSSADECIRASLLKFNGYPDKDPDTFSMVNRFQDGNYGHLMWQMVMWDMGILERAEFPVEVVKWGAKGTCDGVLAIPDFSAVGGYDPRMSRQDVRDIVESGDVKVTRLIAEIKRAAEFRWSMMQSLGEPEPKIVWQGSLYYHGAKEVLTKAESKTLKGVCYWLENKNNNDIFETDLAPTAQGTQAMEDFYGKAVKFAARGRLPKRPYEEKSKECNRCWVHEHCVAHEGKKRIAPWKGINLGEFAERVLSDAA